METSPTTFSHSLISFPKQLKQPAARWISRRALLLLAAFQPLWTSAVTASSLEFIYLDANTGSASGGHIALKLDDRVYHYQNDQGYSRLSRDEWRHFQHAYNDLENRNLHLARIELRTEDIRQIKDHLDLLFLIQNRHLDFLNSLRRDVSLLDDLKSGYPSAIPGLGFFSQTPQQSPATTELRQRVVARMGSHFIPNQTSRLRGKLASIAYAHGSDESADLSPNHYPSYPVTFSEQIDDLYLRWFALNIISQGWGIRENGLIDVSLPGDSSKLLTVPERARLAIYRDQLADSIITSLTSRYTGGASHLLLAIARYQAIARSLNDGRLWLLDVTPTDPALHSIAITEERIQPLKNQHARILQQLPRLRQAFAETPEESTLQPLEYATSLLRETERGLKTGQAIRFNRRSAPPTGMGLATLPVSSMDAAALERAYSLATARVEAFQDQIEERYAYRLIDRNCVTELVGAMNASFPDPKASEKALGGLIVPGESQGFIPYRFFELVRARYAVTGVYTLPSFRNRGLQRMADSNADWMDLAAETATPLSRLYRPRDGDTAFVLFTENVFWQRPVYGTVNLAFGMSAVGAGLLMAPADQGNLFREGLRGALFSLPELAFWNIRKGSYEETPLEAEPYSE